MSGYDGATSPHLGPCDDVSGIEMTSSASTEHRSYPSTEATPLFHEVAISLRQHMTLPRKLGSVVYMEVFKCWIDIVY